jgi:hypothetical protein
LTPTLAALVLHTQMAKVAVRPALTSAELEKDSTRTQSCGVLRGCGDFVGLGVGLGDVGVGVGVGGAGLDELTDGVELPVVEGDFASELDVLGDEEGLTPADWLSEGEALGKADALLPAELLLRAKPLGEADVLRLDLPGDAEADADSPGL